MDDRLLVWRYAFNQQRNLMARSRKVFYSITITVVVIGAVLYFGGRALMVAYFVPPAEFVSERQPQALDYRGLNAWAAHPGKVSAAKLSPNRQDSKKPAQSPAVFFVHPTTYFGPGEWNANPRQSSFASQGIEHVLATQASAFSSCCDIYAPQYRQAHIAVFGYYQNDHSLRALDLAYADVAAAFEQFLREIGNRPFVLAAHSQGTLHLQRILASYLSGQQLRHRLVAAYLIGYWLPEHAQQQNFADIPLCSEPSATGCVIAYDTYNEEGLGPPEDVYLPMWFQNGWRWSNRRTATCINPLSWQQNEARVEAKHHLGALPNQPGGSFVDFLLNRDAGIRYPQLPPLLTTHTYAKCDKDGLLRLASQHDTPFASEGRGPDGSLHRYDWNLFYMNIRTNALRRIESFQVQFGTDNSLQNQL